jgi:uncharacterized protein YegJ (DUF2314 family)
MTSLHRLLIAGFITSVLGSLVVGRIRAAEGPDGKKQGGEKIVSIVFLLKEPRQLDIADLRKQAAKVYGKPFGDRPNDGNVLIKLKEMLYGISVDGVNLGLINVSNPYVDDREAMAKTIPETRLKEAVRTHKAWISLDAVGEVKEADREKIYRLIAKFMVSIAGDDVLAIYAPETGKMIWYEPRIIEKLKGDHPLDAFNWDDPLIGVPEGDPEMKAAVQKAHDTFPKFAQAFARPKPGQHFAAKGYFGAKGTGEYMWITVTSINGDVIVGTLDNLPGAVKDLHVGDRVEIKTAELNDWLIVEGDKKTLTGGYTIEVVSKRMKDPAPKK